MSKPRYDWWDRAIWCVKIYPTRKNEYDKLHSQSATASPEVSVRADGINRKTENISLRRLPPAKQEEYDAVNKALEITAKMPDGRKRIELIKRKYWDGKNLRITDVVMHIGISDVTGFRWHGAFIKLVGLCLGYER